VNIGHDRDLHHWGYSLAGMASSRIRALFSVLSALAAAEAAVRLLAPRRPPISPAPVVAGDHFEPAEVERGARFARPQLGLALAGQAIQLALLGAETARVRGRPRRRRGVTDDVLATGRLVATLSAGTLPLSVVARRRAMAVGLDTQSWSGWAADTAKASAIMGVLSLGGGAGISALIDRYPRRWWLPAAAGSVVAGGLFGALAPVLLDPLFNDFKALPEGPVRADVLDLAGRAGVRVGQVYSVDASRRTSGANAYVNGLGPTKRVVLYDTLLDRYSPGEVSVVVAHELSHVRHRDVARALAFSALVAGPAARAVAQLSRELSPGRRPPTIPALALAFTLVAGPMGLIARRLSRAIERRADADSLRLAGDPGAFISFQRAVALQNVADVRPRGWVRRLLASHPPTLERIGAAVAFSQLAGGS
jgi:Zn-dependent protease with chaperone function